MSENKRASFGGKLSVILVAAGSAIGLGAIWRFPYIAGENGGAAFVLVFLLSVLVVGIPAMLAEFAIGRYTRKNAVGAFRSLSKRWSWLGYGGVLCALFISGYYYLIAGWSLEYLVNSATGQLYSSSLSFTEQFKEFQASWRPLIYGVIFIFMTYFIVSRGVEKGIEKASKIMMPLLFVILIVMAVRVAFMPGASEGYRFFLSCDFAQAFKPETIMMAIGQAFFSSSVGMGDGYSILISDFLTDENYENAIDTFAEKRRDILCIQVLSREELNPQMRGKMHLFDSEDPSSIFRRKIDRDRINAYKAALRFVTDRIKDYCESRGGRYLLVPAEASLGEVFFGDLVDTEVMK